MKIKLLLLLCLGVAFVSSCKNDDESLEPETTAARGWAEVEAENDSDILEYLETHFYNYEEFQDSIPNYDASFDKVIRIDTIAGDNAGKQPLSDFVQSIKVKVDTTSGDDQFLEHTLYYIVAAKGVGAKPTAVDSTYVTYEGSLLNGDIFDASTGAPVWFDLVTAVSGFKNGVAQFKSGGDIIDNGNGTFDVDRSGIGMIIMPSGLAYFSSSTPGETYAPLIFKINLLRARDADHDRDGVPSKIEDRDGDGDILNDDTDEDGFPNYFDTDDDGDGILTRTEISKADGTIQIPYPGSENGGTAHYLNSAVEYDPIED